MVSRFARVLFITNDILIRYQIATLRAVYFMVAHCIVFVSRVNSQEDWMRYLTTFRPQLF